MEKEKAYTGIWMKIGCFLSALAILGIIIIIGIFLFNIWRGF